MISRSPWRLLLLVFGLGMLLAAAMPRPATAGDLDRSAMQVEVVAAGIPQDAAAADHAAPQEGAAAGQADAEHPGAEHAGGGEEGGEHGGGGGHHDLFFLILLQLAVVLSLAMFGRYVATRVHQAKVLGELMVGVIVGNIGYHLGVPIFDLLMNFGEVQMIFDNVFAGGVAVGDAVQSVYANNPDALAAGGKAEHMAELITGDDGLPLMYMGLGIWLFSKLGVILLLFMVGLHNKVHEILGVGGSASRVAVVGVVAPLVLGYLATTMLRPDEAWTVHLFVAAALCATSVGITARVFMDLKALETPSARVILGAAVIDDVLGLVLLAVALNVAKTGTVDAVHIATLTGLAGAFIGSVLLFGERFVGWSARVVDTFDPGQGRILFPVAFACACGWLAGRIGLDPIVGAFAAGLLMRNHFFHMERGSHALEKLFEPVEALFAPVFFVLMGAQVNLAVFADITVLGLAGVLLVVAVIGKLAAGWVAGGKTHAWSVGIGMVPRGEVGLVFAAIGRGSGILNDELFSALVVVIVLSTLVTPPALRWSVANMRKELGEDPVQPETAAS